ncbi:probable Isocitrate lyase [Zygosaccharomyces bailii ISA1307]|nr:probable Isocitrate lyase [Zygosaccharomyces bailii ISA1307]
MANIDVSKFSDFNLLQKEINGQAAEVEKWWSHPRWAQTKRTYTARDIAVRSGTFAKTEFPSSVQARKLYAVLQKHHKQGTTARTFGALDPVHVTQMAKYLDTIYVSGWQCSSTSSTSNEPGPDLADYPMDTVPNKTEHLFKAQQFHDRKQLEARSHATNQKELDALGEPVDYMTPIVADADAGHGGLTAVFKLTKMFIERGAAGIHMEDQTSTNKKCGHMAGRCVVPVQEHVNRLNTIRMCADIMRSDLVIVARTDSEAATLLSSSIDPRDHYYIVGATNPAVAEEPFAEVMNAAVLQGCSGAELQQLEQQWIEKADLKLFHEAFRDEVQKSSLPNKKEILSKFYAKVGPYTGTSIREQRRLARELLGHDIFFDWDVARVREGLYRYQGGTKCAVMRARAFAPFADLVWMESNYPDYEQAVEFAEGVRAEFPGKMLAYNLSPSFNWTTAMSVQEQGTFIERLGRLGYCWQFITLAGLHTTALAVSNFSKDYAKRGMEAYAQDIQKMEMETGVDVLKHQQWSGANYVDSLLKLAQGGLASTAAMGKGVTEDQFKSHL